MNQQKICYRLTIYPLSKYSDKCNIHISDGYKTKKEAIKEIKRIIRNYVE